MEILRLSLDVEPLPHEGFRPGELRMNEQAKIPHSSINKKTQQTEQRGTSETELKARKYLALLVALFPHCLITPRNFASQSKILTREPRILDQIDCRAKASACRNKPDAPGIKNPSFLAVKNPHQIFLLSS